MGLFDRNNRKGGLMDEIRCDEPSYLIWKWHPSGSQPGANNRENAIRWGSSLRVKDGEVVSVKVESPTGRSLVFGDTVVRVSSSYALAMHVDTDESNAAGLAGVVYGELVK